MTLTPTDLGSAARMQERGMLVRLDGPRILDPDGVILAELSGDGDWYTSRGERCHGLIVPAPRAQPHVTSRDRAAARRVIDAEWMQEAIEAIRRLTDRNETITSDDVWAEIQMPPREPRMIGNALSRARGLGLIEPTDEHRPSDRKNNNHARPVRVWRCLRTAQQPLR